MNIAIFASGAGSNAGVVIKTLPTLLQQKNTIAHIALIITNNEKAGVLTIASQNQIPSKIIQLKGKNDAEIDADYLAILTQYKIDFIVLAGYLKKIPLAVIKTYPKKIINIHPALLPAYGGVGMYGMHVHDAVIKAHEKQSGISIHYVDEVYDHGKIIFQASVNIQEGETAESLAKKVLQLEHKWYARIICDCI